MDLQTYQTEAIKTIKWRKSQEEDCDHMIIGMFSEINEMNKALRSGDIVNIKEELGDMSWYPVNYATIRKISISQQTDVGEFGILEYTDLTSDLCDILKKWMIYNKEMDGETRNREIILVQKIINCICNFAPKISSYGDGLQLPNRDPKAYEVININEVWQMNIDKLHKKRYKNATYSDEQANNRNIEEERKTLEGK